MNGQQTVLVEHFLDARRRRALVGAGKRGINCPPIGVRQRRTQVLKRVDDTRHLRRQRLELDDPGVRRPRGAGRQTDDGQNCAEPRKTHGRILQC